MIHYKIPVKLKSKNNYEIIIGEFILDEALKLYHDFFRNSQLFVITNEALSEVYKIGAEVQRDWRMANGEWRMIKPQSHKAAKRKNSSIVDSLSSTNSQLSTINYQPSTTDHLQPSKAQRNEETKQFADLFINNGLPVSIYILPDGEKYKTLDSYRKILEQISLVDDERNLVVVGIGGGVVGDIAGFAAGTYKRGKPLIQIPTTLLASVDSSIGGKTGVDLPKGKNLVGVFHQPKLVIIDLAFLKTLPRTELLMGLAEVIKYGIIFDGKLFDYVNRHIDSIFSRQISVLSHIVKRSAQIKVNIVKQDERDTKNIRALLNFGHTFGHAFEAAFAYKELKHGEAVSIGMLCAAETSKELGLCTQESVEKINNLLLKAGLPTTLPSCDIDKIIEHLKLDKKFSGGKTKLVLIEEIGKGIVKDGINYTLIKKIIKKRIC